MTQREALIAIINDVFEDQCFGEGVVTWYDQEGDFAKVWPVIADKIIASGWRLSEASREQEG